MFKRRFPSGSVATRAVDPRDEGLVLIKPEESGKADGESKMEHPPGPGRYGISMYLQIWGTVWYKHDVTGNIVPFQHLGNEWT